MPQDIKPIEYEAVDLSLIQSANYWVSRSLGPNLEHMAEFGFREFVQRFVCAPKLCLPYPLEGMGRTNPLIDLWDAEGIPIRKAGPPISPGPLTLSKFEARTGRDPENYASWLRMQLTPQIGKEYFSRANVDHVNAVMGEVRVGLDAGRFAPLRDEIAKVFKPTFTFHKKHFDHLRKSSLPIYGIAYLYSCYVRGLSYGLRVSALDAAYTAHWYRDSVTRDHQVGRAKPVQAVLESDWGAMIYQQIEGGNLKRSLPHVVECLQHLRRYVRGYNDRVNSTKPQEIRDFEIEALMYAKLPPLYRRKPKLLHELGKYVPRSWPQVRTAFDHLQIAVNSRKVRAIDFRLQKAFLQNRVWKNFFAPGIVD